MKDFEEIAHSGGKIQIVINDTRVHFKIEHNNSTKVKIECLQFDLGVNTLPIYIISDSEGMFGAHCSECDNYFRTSNLSSEMFCPYCGIKNDITNFLTKNQNEFIEKYIEVFQSLFSQGKSGEIEFDKLVDCIGEKNSFTYSEERQQTNFTCSECEVSNDVIGKYANCSNCGKRNSIDIFRKNISFESDRIVNPRYNDDNSALREKEWIDVLKNAVSIFEGYAKDINNEILKMKLHCNQRKELENISYQRILEANEKLKVIFNFELLENLPSDDLNFVNKMFHRRHLFTHNDGIVDDYYLKKTNDQSLRAGQLVRVKSKEVKRLLDILNKVGEKFWYELGQFY